MMNFKELREADLEISSGVVEGAVRYAVDGPLRPVVYCHCTQCRKQTGHFVAATRAENADLSVDGADNVTWFSSSEGAERGFCRTCGSVLFWRMKGSARTSIMAGGFDKPSGLGEGFHIYCADMGDYYTLHDDLPKHEQAD